VKLSLREIGRIVYIEIRDLKLQKMHNSWNFKFPEG